MSRFNIRSRSEIQAHLNNILTNDPYSLEDSEEDNELEENNDLPLGQEGGARPNVQGENAEDGSENNEAPRRSHDPYNEGTIVLENSNFRFKAKSMGHTRQTRYRLSDHLYTIWVEEKKRNLEPPLLLDLEEGLEAALIHVLDDLKRVYEERQYQIYVTIIDRSIRSGLNSGNYSLQTPSEKIARWMMAMLYNYLKSNQTLRLNYSFKIQIKVLSIRHTQNLQQNRPNFTRHVYH